MVWWGKQSVNRYLQLHVLRIQGLLEPSREECINLALQEKQELVGMQREGFMQREHIKRQKVGK